MKEVFIWTVVVTLVMDVVSNVSRLYFHDFYIKPVFVAINGAVSFLLLVLAALALAGNA